MPLCSIIGLLFPNVSNAVLPWLPQILFFLMFFTLLGIDQKALFGKLALSSVWGFATFQNVILCLLTVITGFLLGIRGDLLLAITAFGATAPLFGSGAIVNAMGFDALLAMAKTIVATLIMPVTLFMVLWLLAGNDAHLDIVAYGKRLVIYIVMPMLLSVVIKRIIPSQTLANYYPKVGQFNVILLLMFPLGLMGGFRELFDANPVQAMYLLAVAVGLTLFIFASTYILYRSKGDKQRAVISATVSSGRNVLLTYTIAMPFLGAMFLPLIGAIQLPMFSIPFFAKKMLEVTKN